MTQEELDALMAGGIEEETSQTDDNTQEEVLIEEEIQEDIQEEDISKNESSEIQEDVLEEEVSPESFKDSDEILEDEPLLEEELTQEVRIDPTSPTPPPADNEHRVVEQLDDVTRESEIKANEVFDKLDEISLVTTNIKNSTTEQIKIIESNIDIFDRLSKKFPQIESFVQAHEDNQKALNKLNEVSSESDNISNIVMDTMDIMQYQDIHRQKIERVINVMRALSHYMHSLFDSSVNDEHRTSSAITIDSSNSVSEDELEALLESFAKK